MVQTFFAPHGAAPYDEFSGTYRFDRQLTFSKKSSFNFRHTIGIIIVKLFLAKKKELTFNRKPSKCLTLWWAILDLN